jgi:hypothetical protein
MADKKISELEEKTILEANDEFPFIRNENGTYVNYKVKRSNIKCVNEVQKVGITLAPQFETYSLDLSLKKGESAQFSVAVTDYDLDLRGCLIISEIRRLSPGYNLVSGFTGIATNGSSIIQIKRYPLTDDKFSLLNLLPVRVGDLITLEGSGITGLKVVAVTDSQITISGVAARTINEGRLLVRSLSLASFNAVPYLPNITVTLAATAPIGSTSLNVSGVTRLIPSGTTLVFNNSNVADPVILTTDLKPGDTTAFILTSTVAITAYSTAIVGASTVITTNNAAVNATSITVSPLSVPMPANTTLNFATRTSDGWQYVGSSRLTSAVLANATSLPVAALSVAIPSGAIAWFGSHTFNSFYLAIAPADTQFLESGNYGYDVICRQPDGYTIRLIQGNVQLTNYYSDEI